MEFFTDNINLVIFLPLIMCAIIGFNGLVSNKIDKATLFAMSVVSSFLCVLFSGAAFDYSWVRHLSFAENFQWLSFENINFYLGTLLDNASVSFLLVSAVLVFLIQNLAFFKLKEHNDFPRLLFYINLFTFGLNGIFLSPNLFQTYLFCEVTGVAGYLLINFDFSNREESKAGIKSFIYNRIGDLTLLLCVLTIMYYSVVYNQLSGTNALAYADMTNIAACINSLMSTPAFVFFCSLLIFVIIMKFIQAFVYITFETRQNSAVSKIVFYINALLVLTGVYLFVRLNPFFFELGADLLWTLLVVVLLFAALGIVNRLFLPFCKMAGWIEKYVVETVINFVALAVRALSYLSGRFQGGNFQSYLIYSIAGLALIFGFVLIFYVMLIKV